MSDVSCSPPQDSGKFVSVSADSDMPADRSTYVHPWVTLCQQCVWQVETETCFRWAVCCSMAPWGDVPWCHTADVFLDVAAGLLQQHPEPSTEQGQINGHRQRPHPSATLLLDSMLNHYCNCHLCNRAHQPCHAIMSLQS